MPIILPAIISFLATAFSTPLTIKLAKKYGLVDDPKKRPHPAHLHKNIVARAGGLPVFIGILTGILFFVPLERDILGIIAALSLLLVVGLLDDLLKNFSPYPRLALQFAAAGIAVAAGVGISFITYPFGGILRLDQVIVSGSFLGFGDIPIIADIFAFLWIVWLQNCINWSNGVDGQTPGIVAVAALIIGGFSYKLYLQGDPNQLAIASLSFVTAGAALGLLIFNWHPAKIFPGFSGNTIFGFMIATLSILSGAKLAIALLILLVPATDFFYTFFRRILSGHSPFIGDRQHLHHLLLEKGLSPQQISLFYIASCAILGLLAINLPSKGKLFTIVGVGVVILAGILWLRYFGVSSKQSDPDNG